MFGWETKRAIRKRLSGSECWFQPRNSLAYISYDAHIFQFNPILLGSNKSIRVTCINNYICLCDFRFVPISKCQCKMEYLPKNISSRFFTPSNNACDRKCSHTLVQLNKLLSLHLFVSVSLPPKQTSPLISWYFQLLAFRPHRTNTYINVLQL